MPLDSGHVLEKTKLLMAVREKIRQECVQARRKAKKHDMRVRRRINQDSDRALIAQGGVVANQVLLKIKSHRDAEKTRSREYRKRKSDEAKRLFEAAKREWEVHCLQ